MVPLCHCNKCSPLHINTIRGLLTVVTSGSPSEMAQKKYTETHLYKYFLYIFFRRVPLSYPYVIDSLLRVTIAVWLQYLAFTHRWQVYYHVVKNVGQLFYTVYVTRSMSARWTELWWHIMYLHTMCRDNNLIRTGTWTITRKRYCVQCKYVMENVMAGDHPEKTQGQRNAVITMNRLSKSKVTWIKKFHSIRLWRSGLYQRPIIGRSC